MICLTQRFQWTVEIEEIIYRDLMLRIPSVIIDEEFHLCRTKFVDELIILDNKFTTKTIYAARAIRILRKND